MEEWIDINNFEGYYQVSNKGRVRSLDRTVTGNRNSSDRHLKGQIIVQILANNGYWMVQLSKNGKMYNLYVHRLIAIAFIPDIENKRCINHKDLNKNNNNLDNLEWCTHKENTQHAIDNGIQFGRVESHEVTQETKDKISKALCGENSYTAKLTDEKVTKIRESHLEGKTIKELGKQFGVSYGTIYNIVKRISWKHI